MAILAIIVLAGLTALLAMAADFGHINVARSEMKRSADAAALSACWELYDGTVSGASAEATKNDIVDMASQIASANEISSRGPALNGDSDVEVGYYDPDQPGQIDTSVPDRFNAVRVNLSQIDGSNGEVPLFFGDVTGRHSQSMQTSSIAAMFKAISGFKTPPSSDQNLQILPIALDLETWESVVAKETTDNFKYVNGQVTSGSDGYFECSLFPTGTGSPGNRGTVDIGSSNNSTSDLRRQILHGISADDMNQLGKPLQLDTAGTLELNGDTGLSAGIKAQLEQIIGQKRIIPIFTTVSGNGNNATYTIVRFEGIRVLGVKLTGPMNKKHLTIQPAPMVARHSIILEGGVEESDFLFTPVMLVE
ncbi:TadG family pilus assembly protein [Stieleria varia]|uniref:Flp pilus-assembly TadG-like N-terminal domain-containing protein n=1 Tax=Stieleria varia TaxID=2528005 RepID=A0A5C6AUV6_9BACT|nr:TadG family pilus assembly protein [Stieleria varia]TWU02802.1 hypothetical protein Pla52n_38620 [Stieleria varia]